MIELGQLEAHQAEFDKRKVRVVVASLEDQAEAKQTQADFPHLIVVADSEGKLAKAVEVIHRQSSPEGKDTSAPTTLLLDGNGVIRWTFRPDRVLYRLTPAQVLTAIDENIPRH